MIITGRVSSVQFCELETYNDDKTTNQLKVKLITFELTEVYKGGSGRFIKIITGVGGGDCGQEFIVGEDYVIFAMDQSIYNTKMDDGLYETTICRGNGLVSESEISVKILNMLKSGMKIE